MQRFKLPEVDKRRFSDAWNVAKKGPRPEFFQFSVDLITTLRCKECDGTFYSTERFADNYHEDELICQGCGRIIMVHMATDGKSAL